MNILTKQQSEDLLNELNKSPDPLFLHDATLLNFRAENDEAEFIFVLGECQHDSCAVDFDEIWQDPENFRLILGVVFKGVTQLEYDKEFNYVLADIYDNENRDGNGMFYSFGNDKYEQNKGWENDYTEVQFKFASFEWKVYGLFDDDEVGDIYNSTDLPREQWHHVLNFEV